MEIRQYPHTREIRTTDVESVNRLLSQQIAKGTRRVYVSDFKIFTHWCAAHGVDPKNAEPEAIAVFLANEFEGGVHPSTLNRRLSAIRFAYKSMGRQSPTDHDLVRATLKGIKRDENAPPTHHKNPLTNNVLINIIQYVPFDSVKGIRNRAVLLLLFAGAFRRSELVNVRFDDVAFVEKGLDVVIRHSKTNQEGKRQMKSIVKGDIFCPVAAVKNWVDKASISEGYLFRALTRTQRVTSNKMCENSVYYLVKHYAQMAGYDIDHFSPHSLRAGFITSAVENGKNVYKTMDVSLHASMSSLKPYIRFADRYKDHPGDGLL